jgi:hypothetical protein
LTWKGMPGAGVGKGAGNAARRATVFVGVTCGEALPRRELAFPNDCEVVELVP